MNDVMRFAVLLTLVLVCCSQASAAEARPAESDEGEQQSSQDASVTEFVFKRDPQRRDPFYSVLDVVEVQIQIKQFLEEQNEESTSKETGTEFEGPIVPLPDNKVKAALAKARNQAKRASLALLEGNWKVAVNSSDEGLQILQAAVTYEGADQFAREINSVVVQLNGFKSTAIDAQLNEEAEAKFNALELEVQGIMWSADKRSLAIISGEAFFVQDKIGDGDDSVTIVNIDPNRVDFMINHKRKRFEFKRYINN